jgi:hypothetical protein
LRSTSVQGFLLYFFMGVLYPKAGWLSRNFFGVAKKFFLTFYIILGIIPLKENRTLFGITKIFLDCILIYAYNSYSEMEKAIHKTERIYVRVCRVYILHDRMWIYLSRIRKTGRYRNNYRASSRRGYVRNR